MTVDLAGWCVATLHDFHAGATPYVGGRGLAVSPDNRYVYVGTYGTKVLRIDTTTWTVDDPWVTLSASIFGIAADSTGNLYVSLTDNTLAKITAAGTVTAGWASLPVGWSINTGLSLGRDGNLYASGRTSLGNLDTVFAVSAPGVVTEVWPFRTATADAGYDFATAIGNGIAFASLDSPPAPYVGVDTTLRRAAPIGRSPIDVTRIAQWVVAHTGDASLGETSLVITTGVGPGTADLDILAVSITGGATLDFSSSTWAVIDQDTAGTVSAYLVARPWVPNPGPTPVSDIIPITGSGRWYAQGAGDSVNGLTLAHIGAGAIKAYDPGTLTWLAAPSIVGTGEVMFFLAAGWFDVSEPSLIPTFADPTPGAGWRTTWEEAEYGDVTAGYGTGGSGSWRAVGRFADPVSPTGPIAVAPSALAKGHAAVIYVGADLHAGVVTDLPIQTLADPADDGDTEAYGGLFVTHDDYLLIPMTRYGSNGTSTANLGWWLRVAPDGTASRVAGTWSYTGSPSPRATSTDIVDGPLPAALCAELDSGAGINANRDTVYFIDDGNELSGVQANLLRTLGLCAQLPRQATAGVASVRLHRVGGGVQ